MKSVIIGLCISIIFYIGFQIYSSPFKTEDQKQIEPIYKAAMEGVSYFRLSSIIVDKEELTVRYHLKLKNRTSSECFTEQEMESINLVVEQLIEYLNTKDNLNYLYTDYCVQFQIGNTPVGITCWLKEHNGQYEFISASSKNSNNITDFYKMKEVQEISIDGGNHIFLDDEKLNKFSGLHNLEKIYFIPTIYEEDITQFVNKMKVILPSCKIFMKGEEVVPSS